MSERLPDIVFPLPVADGSAVVKLCNLPADLTVSDAEKAAIALNSLREYLLSLAGG